MSTLEPEMKKFLFSYSVRVRHVKDPVIGAIVVKGAVEEFARKDCENIIRNNIHDILSINISTGKEIKS